MDGGFAGRKVLGLLSGSGLPGAGRAPPRLGTPAVLAAGPRPAADLAATAGADPQALRRILRALAAAGVMRRTTTGEYELTAVGELLRTDVPGSLHQTAVMDGEEVYRAFAEIMYAARTGKPAFDKVFGGSFYAYLDGDPQAADTFHAAMGGAGVPAAWADCDLTDVGTLVDVGGGTGGLLAQTLSRHPSLHGMLLELPDAIRRASDTLAGVIDRVTLVEGSFFQGVPAGAAAHVPPPRPAHRTPQGAPPTPRPVPDAPPPRAR